MTTSNSRRQLINTGLVASAGLPLLAASARRSANETVLVHNGLESYSRAPEITPQLTRVSR